MGKFEGILAYFTLFQCNTVYTVFHVQEDQIDHWKGTVVEIFNNHGRFKEL